MSVREDGDYVVPSEEFKEAARRLVREARTNLGEIPDGCSTSYAVVSAAIQGIFPAVLESIDPGPNGDPREERGVSLMVQGVGAGLAAFLASMNDTGRGVYLALMFDLIQGMSNVESADIKAMKGVGRAHELLAAFGILPSGKGIN